MTNLKNTLSKSNANLGVVVLSVSPQSRIDCHSRRVTQLGLDEVFPVASIQHGHL